MATFSASLAESAPATDALARTTSASRAFGGTAPAADALARTTLRPRALAETAPAAEVVTRVLAYVRVYSDAAPAVATVYVRRAIVTPTGVLLAPSRTQVDLDPSQTTAVVPPQPGLVRLVA